MAGRPPRTEEVKVVFLRLPTDLLKRITRCTGMIETREGVRLDQTKAFRHLLEIACDAVEHQQTPLAPLAVSETSKLAEIANIANGIPPAYDDMLACLGDEDEEETSVSLPAVTQPAPAGHKNGQRASAMSARAIPLETLQAIADAAAEYDKLSFAQLAQLLYERNIYRAKDPVTGQEKPLNKGTLKKWIERARTAGLL
jgi:hypothetical protein